MYFGVVLDYPLSKLPSDWAMVGGFFGGVLAPLLSFISIVLLIESLNFQKKTNLSLESEIIRSKKLEILKTFESLYFNLIDSQKRAFDLVTLELNNLKENTLYKVSGAEAVIELENLLNEMKDANARSEDITNAIEQLDYTDQIFSQTRIFNNIAKLINERLTLEKGFDNLLIESYYKTLINLTDFNNLKLIAICMKYSNTKIANELSRNKYLLEAFKTFGFITYYNEV